MTASTATDIDLPGLGATEREVCWETAICARLAPMAVRVFPTRGNGAGAVLTREVGDLELAQWDCPPLEGVLSTSAGHRSDRDSVVILAGYGGEERLSFDGTDTVLENGTLVVASGGHAGDGFSVPTRVRKRTLRMPRAALDAAGSGGDIPSCLVLRHDRPLVRVFRALLDEVWRQAPSMNAAEVEAARASFLALVAGAIRAEAGSLTDASALSVLRAQLDNWIIRNLRKGTIRVHDLAAAHHVSARTVHRAFASTGDTMTAVVRAQRLAAVREDLVHTNLKIAAIAHRYGYYDPSHLRREFSRYFSVSPSEYRQRYGLLTSDAHSRPGVAVGG